MRAVGARLQPRVRHLHRLQLVLDGLVQQLQGLLLVEDLLLDLHEKIRQREGDHAPGPSRLWE